MNKVMNVGVVGCGSISDIYLTNMQTRFDNLQVVSCCAAHLENAQKKAEKYGIQACTYDQMLADETIDMVVILTPAPTHYELIRAALLAGKHVYTEKTMTVALQQAKQLLELADQKGLYLGAAPDTFLGAAWQKAKQLIDGGAIGEVTGFNICANRNLDRLTSFYRFLRLPGGGICYDYGVYYLTALVSLLGNVSQVAAVVENRKPVRIDCNPESEDFGKEFVYDNEGQVTALLTMERGISGSFVLNGETIGQDQTLFAIYGTEGILKLTNPNLFGGQLYLVKQTEKGYEQLAVENDLPYGDNSRGIGPSEMADAIFAGRPNKAGKELACHVLGVIEAMMESSKTNSFIKLTG